ncbi:MAG: phenylalanine--tRNA ligase subunit beta [Bacteroidales bacterium]|nr:phenylalanine--tRNA ligase subunit beta [Bacteroidales bacterium]
MKISYNWLRQYIDTNLPPQEISTILTNIGLEVQGVEPFESVKGGLNGVVIGKVLTCEKHPDADKLSLTTVDIGTAEPLHIVCGAPNVKAGQKVPVAAVGTTLYPGEESFTIKKTKIRGQLSEGMICAEDELGLGRDHSGIMVLDPVALVGAPASDYFNIQSDIIFEIDLTPNRIDGASHYGVARDLAAYLRQNGGASLSLPAVDPFPIDNNDYPVDIEIAEPAGCRRYTGITLSGIDVKESPDWLKTRLRSIGLTPINNVVDVTNFVLHEIGQPLHAFDADRITGRKVIVRTRPEGTRFMTLDEKERELLGKDLMICNRGEPMCIAGIFGGITSGVTMQTRNVFLESACFDPVYIRKTARHHQLSTDASFRFERGSDPNITVWALKRAAGLIKEIAGGTTSSEIVDIYPEPVAPCPVEISFEYITGLIGKEIPADTIRSILESLDFRVVEKTGSAMKLEVPTYRVDVRGRADVVEEILRIYGFNNVEISEQVHSTLSYTPKPDKERILNQVSDLLSAGGFYEIKANSLTRQAYYQQEGQDDPEAVKIYNPLSQDLSRMRKTLLYGGLESIAYNINRKNPDLKLYESGYVYKVDPSVQSDNPLDKYSESYRFGLFITGKTGAENWLEKPGVSSFYSIKAYIELVLKRLGLLDKVSFTGPVRNDAYAEGLFYASGKDPIVEFGKVSDRILKQFDISQDVFAAEFNWDHVLQLCAGTGITYRPLPRYPAVQRDLSMMLDRSVTYEQLRELAFKSENRLLKQVSLFDVYEGDKIEKGKKSYALSFTLLDEEKTLTDKQIERVMERIASAFEKELGAVIRRQKAAGSRQ